MIRYNQPVTASAITAATKPGNPEATPAIDSANDRKTRTLYDNDGNVTGTLDAEGYLTESEYDAAGRLIHTVAYAKASPSAYWAGGTIDQLRPATGAQDEHQWKFYDSQDRVTGTVDGEGGVVEYFHDGDGNVVQQRNYVNASRLSPAAITAATKLANVRPAVDARDRIASTNWTKYGQVDTQTDPEGNITNYTYNSAGYLTKKVFAFGTASAENRQYTVDVRGNVTAVTTPTGTTSFTYDAAGRQITSTDPNNNKTLFYYDGDGQLAYAINALGEVTQNTYNNLEDLVKVTRYGTRLSSTTLATLTGGLVNSAVTTAVNNIASGSLDSTVSMTYDLRGEVITKVDALGNSNSFAYDAFGEQSSATLSMSGSVNTVTQTSYSRRGLVTQVVQDVGGVGATTNYTYDADGSLTSKTDADGNVTRYFYVSVRPHHLERRAT